MIKRLRALLPRPRFMREHRWTQQHLSELIDGELAADERDRADRHVGLCPECRRVLATLRTTLAGLRGLGVAEPTHSDLSESVIERLRREG